MNFVFSAFLLPCVSAFISAPNNVGETVTPSVFRLPVTQATADAGNPPLANSAPQTLPRDAAVPPLPGQPQDAMATSNVQAQNMFSQQTNMGQPMPAQTQAFRPAPAQAAGTAPATVATPEGNGSFFGPGVYLGASITCLFLVGGAVVARKKAQNRTAVVTEAGKTASKMKYVDAVKTSDLPGPGKAISCTPGGLDVCIAVAQDGLIYALGNKAPPTGSPLAAGKVSNSTITDAQYGTQFDLKTGQVVGKWCPSGIGFLVGKLQGPSDIPTYKIKKGGANIQVEVDVNYKQEYESNYWRGILDAQGKTDGGYY